jgi:uncharacterized membrane protein YsdA (DUF1294 family)
MTLRQRAGSQQLTAERGGAGAWCFGQHWRHKAKHQQLFTALAAVLATLL